MWFSFLYKLNIFSLVRKFDPSALYFFSFHFLSSPPPLTIEVKLVYRGPDKHRDLGEILTNLSEERQTAKYDQIIFLSFTNICDDLVMPTGGYVLVKKNIPV